MKWNSVKPFKKLLVSQGGSTAGRNNKGRITIWHRGGGAKRLQRKVDVKRNISCMGVVERIEYDPNRSANLALVRWTTEGVQSGEQRICEKDFTPPPPQSSVNQPLTTTVAGQFPLACLTPGHLMRNFVVNCPSDKEAGSKLSSVKDVIDSALSSQRSKGESLHNIPRIAVAGSKPAVFAPQTREQVREGEKAFSLSDVRRWSKDSVLWEHRLQRKAAVSWSSFVLDEPVGLAAAAKSEGKSKTRPRGTDQAAFTYIIASNELKPGTLVMNCDPSIRPTRI